MVLSTIYQVLEWGLRFCICNNSQIAGTAGQKPHFGSKALDYTTLSGSDLKYIPLTVRGFKELCLNTPQ